MNPTTKAAIVIIVIAVIIMAVVAFISPSAVGLSGCPIAGSCP